MKNLVLRYKSSLRRVNAAPDERYINTPVIDGVTKFAKVAWNEGTSYNFAPPSILPDFKSVQTKEGTPYELLLALKDAASLPGLYEVSDQQTLPAPQIGPVQWLQVFKNAKEYYGNHRLVKATEEWLKSLYEKDPYEDKRSAWASVLNMETIQGSGEQPHLSTAQATKFATLAYTYGSGQGDEASKREEVKKELEGTGWSVRWNASNRQLTAFYHEGDDHLHVAHKGTQPNSGLGMMDVVSDIKLGMANESSSYQFNYRLKQTEKIYMNIKPKIFTMSGHSLGGATVIYALNKSKLLTDAIDQADTFNAGANPWPSISENLKYLNPFKYKQYKREDQRRREKLNRVVTHHRIEKDVVSLAMRVKPPTGEIRTYSFKKATADKDVSGNAIGKSLDAHHLDLFDDDGKDYMSNYKSTNYHKGNGKRKAAAAIEEPSGTRMRL